MGAEWRVRDRCLVLMLMSFVYVVSVVDAGSAIFDKGCRRQTEEYLLFREPGDWGS